MENKPNSNTDFQSDEKVRVEVTSGYDLLLRCTKSIIDSGLKLFVGIVGTIIGVIAECVDSGYVALFIMLTLFVGWSFSLFAVHRNKNKEKCKKEDRCS